MSRRRSLGRGLDALLAGTDAAAPGEPAVAVDRSAAVQPSAGVASAAAEVPVEQIQRSRYQPRRHFGQDALEELAASIRVHGVMQPIVVRAVGPQRYELVAGERRWRAAQLANLPTIPAVLRTVSDDDALALALIENIQREDLGPLEQALALQRLREEFDLTQQQIADMVGKSRAAVTNLLRLLSLEGAVRDLLDSGALEMGHARALLTLPEGQQLALARDIVDRRLSVREAERQVRQLQRKKATGTTSPRQRPDADRVSLERDIGDRVGAPVSIRHRASGAGQLVIKYSTVEELEGILDHIK